MKKHTNILTPSHFVRSIAGCPVAHTAVISKKVSIVRHLLSRIYLSFLFLSFRSLYLLFHSLTETECMTMININNKREIKISFVRCTLNAVSSNDNVKTVLIVLKWRELFCSGWKTKAGKNNSQLNRVSLYALEYAILYWTQQRKSACIIVVVVRQRWRAPLWRH